MFRRSVLILLALVPFIAQAADPVSIDLSAIDVAMSMNGKTLTTVDGTWNFGPNVGAGGNEILINGNGSNGGQAKILEVADTGKMFALANDNSWWVYAKTTGWSKSPGPPLTVTCIPPTTYTNGATINLHLTFQFIRGTTSKDLTTEVIVEQQCSHTYYGLQGTNFFTVTAKDPSGSESAISNQYYYGLIYAAPQAPTNMVIKGNAQVYAVKQSKDHLATTVPVGTVPLNTPCNTIERVNNMFVVPRDQVTWYGNVKPQAVVAECFVP